MFSSFMKALNYASRFTTVTQQDRHIIIHAKKSLLYHQDSPWIKKNTNDMFDVTMGSYDGAETCELIGNYMLALIAPKFKNEVGLYRDDGLAICKATPKEIEKTKQEVNQVFKSEGLKITIEANKKIVNFLDVTFNITDGSYKPYMKPNNKLSYVHQQSNHPPAVLKNIPLNINKRLTAISSSKETFDDAPYQKALTESGYNYKLTYNPPQEQARKNKRKRTRNITWYNPPFNSNIKTNLGRKFLHIVDRCFPKHHPLHKIFNIVCLKILWSGWCLKIVCLKIELLMHAKHEIYHLIAQQARSFKCKLTNARTWHLQLQKKTGLSTRRKMPPNKRHLPSHCNH